MSASNDDIGDMIADAERAHRQAAAGAAGGDDIDAMIDSALASKSAPTNEPIPRGLNVDESPLPDPIGSIDPRLGEHPTQYANSPLVPDPEELKATRAGVAVDSPAPAGHVRASFAYDDEERRKAYEMDVKQAQGGDSIVEIGPTTKQIEWLLPKTNPDDPEEKRRFGLASPPRAGAWEKIEGAAGGSVVAIPELIGNWAGGALTKTPTGIALGGGAGAFTGELIRLYTGKYHLGINQKMTDKQAVSRAEVVGGVSAGIGVGANALMRLGQFVKHAVAGEPVAFSKEMSDSLGMTIDESAEMADKINTTIRAEKLRMVNAGEKPDVGTHKYDQTLGQASGNKQQLALEEELKRSKEFQAQFGEFNEQSQLALKDFYTVISKPFERGSIPPDRALKMVRSRSNKALNHAEKRITEHMARYEAQAVDAIENVETVPLRSLGGVARGVGDAENQAFQDRAEQLAGNIKTLAGDAPIIGNTNTAGVYNTLDERARNIVIPGRQRKARAAQDLPPGAPSDVAANPDTTLGALYDAKSQRTFAESWDTLSDLKKAIRNAAPGNDTDTGALKAVVKAMEADMFESVGNTKIGQTYRDFTSWYRTETARLNSGVVGQVLDKDGGILDGEVFNRIFPQTGGRRGGGVEETAQFMDLIKYDPQAIGAFRKAIADDWRQFSVDNGRVDPKKSAQWLRVHADQMSLEFQGLNAPLKKSLSEISPKGRGEALFTAKEIAEVGAANDFSGVLAKRQKLTDETIAALNKSLGADLRDLKNPGQLNLMIMSDLSGNTAAKVLRHMRREPVVTQGIQASYLGEMRDRVINMMIPGSREKQVNPNALRMFLYGKGDGGKGGQENVIKQLFGPEYLEGLKTLEHATSQSAQQSVAPNFLNTAGWMQGKVVNLITRAYFGPLSHSRTVIGAGQEAIGMATDRVAARAVLNPGNMKQLMSIWHKDLSDRKVIAVLTQLGFGPNDFQPDVGKQRSTAKAMSELNVFGP